MSANSPERTNSPAGGACGGGSCWTYCVADVAVSCGVAFCGVGLSVVVSSMIGGGAVTVMVVFVGAGCGAIVCVVVTGAGVVVGAADGRFKIASAPATTTSAPTTAQIHTRDVRLGALSTTVG